MLDCVLLSALPAREGEVRFEEPTAVKDTIFELAHTNKVSIPSELFVEAGVGAGLLVLRAGRLKLRFEGLEEGGCVEALKGAGEDMMCGSSGHGGPADLESTLRWRCEDSGVAGSGRVMCDYWVLEGGRLEEGSRCVPCSTRSALKERVSR